MSWFDNPKPIQEDGESIEEYNERMQDYYDQIGLYYEELREIQKEQEYERDEYCG